MLTFYFSIHCYISLGTIVNKFLYPIGLSLAGPLLCMNRGLIMIMLFAASFMFLLRYRIKVKFIITAIIFLLLTLYLFGVSGNFRINDSSGESFLHTGGATDEFRNSIIPKEYFWSYIYMVTPIGNLQNAININKTLKEDENGYESLIAHEILPSFIGKRLNVKSRNGRDYLVVPALNVGTMYFGACISKGIEGMAIVFLVMIFYCIFMLKTVSNKCIFYIPMLCILSSMIFFSIFSNMVVFMGLLPQLAIIFFLRHKQC